MPFLLNVIWEVVAYKKCVLTIQIESSIYKLEQYHLLYVTLDTRYYLKNLFPNQRGTCMKGLICPPLEPKTENCFSQISFDWFIRRMTEG